MGHYSFTLLRCIISITVFNLSRVDMYVFSVFPSFFPALLLQRAKQKKRKEKERKEKERKGRERKEKEKKARGMAFALIMLPCSWLLVHSEIFSFPLCST